MLIKIIPPVPAGQTAIPFSLVDDTVPAQAGISSWPQGAGGLCKSGLVPEMTLATEHTELINAPWANELPLLNAQITYSFDSSRVFDTMDNAAAFLADHLALVPTVGTLMVQIGQTTRYLANAVLTSVRVTECSGESNTIAYTYKGSYVPPILNPAGTGTGGPFQTAS
jgi:hypothetical protein